MKGLFFAGSHGFEIVGPEGTAVNYTFAQQLLPPIRDAMSSLAATVVDIPGVSLEDNKFMLSVHTRNVSAVDMPRLNELIEAALEEQPLMRRAEGIHVIELRPQVGGIPAVNCDTAVPCAAISCFPNDLGGVAQGPRCGMATQVLRPAAWPT